MNEKIIQFQGAIPQCGIKTMSDRGIRLWFDTQELPPEDMAKIFAKAGKPVHIAIAETNIEPDMIDVKELAKELKTDKTPSQRLRSVLFVMWKETTNQEEDFEIFYRHKMEVFIDKIKSLLPDK